MATADEIREALAGADLPAQAMDGDCLPLSGLVSMTLRERGIESSPVFVTGYSTLMGQEVVVFMHAATKVDGLIVDSTATQFNRALPSLIILPEGEYASMLGKATGTEVRVGGFGKEAMPTSWRPLAADHYWTDYDVTISSEGGASGRKQFEIHVNGTPFANRPTLTEAKQAVEDRYGALQWRTVRLDKMEANHYFFGPTTEFTSPLTIWVADLSANPVLAGWRLVVEGSGGDWS